MKNAQMHSLILLTCVFAVFTLGLCAGRNLNRTPIQIHNLSAATPVSASTISESPADPTIVATKAAPETEFVGPGVVNINTATSEQLQTLDGIGSVLADRIITYRQEYGDFQSIGELMNVSGIGEKKLEAIWDLITIGG